MDIADMEYNVRSRVERIALVALTVISGIFLPIFTAALAPPEGMVNPFWGSIFGLGFWVEYTLFGFPPFGILALLWGVVGIIIWPIVVMWVFNRLLKRILRSSSPVTRIIFYGGMISTLIYNVPITQVQNSYVNYLPIFVRYIDFGPR